MTKLRFVAQIKTKNGWFDEFWTYDPFEFYTGFDHFKLLAPNMWRGVLRIVETEFFEQIKIIKIKQKNVMLNIVNLSGGKDSTAMLFEMIKKGYPIDAIIFCDTGAEFPEMYAHIDKVEKMIGREIIRQKSSKDFFFLFQHFVKKNGVVGYSWPDMKNRWCTQRLKKDESKKALTKIKKAYGDRDVCEYVGIAADEYPRTLKNKEKLCRYPLIGWHMEESDCLKYCYEKGLDWGGLYEKFDRVSCWCCPFSSLRELEILYNDYPLLWNKLKSMDSNTWRSFKQNASIEDLENRFMRNRRPSTSEPVRKTSAFC